MNKILSMLALSTIASTSTPTFSQLILNTSVNNRSTISAEPILKKIDTNLGKVIKFNDHLAVSIINNIQNNKQEISFVNDKGEVTKIIKTSTSSFYHNYQFYRINNQLGLLVDVVGSEKNGMDSYLIDDNGNLTKLSKNIAGDNPKSIKNFYSWSEHLALFRGAVASGGDLEPWFLLSDSGNLTKLSKEFREISFNKVNDNLAVVSDVRGDNKIAYFLHSDGSFESLFKEASQGEVYSPINDFKGVFNDNTGESFLLDSDKNFQDLGKKGNFIKINDEGGLFSTRDRSYLLDKSRNWTDLGNWFSYYNLLTINDKLAIVNDKNKNSFFLDENGNLSSLKQNFTPHFKINDNLVMGIDKNKEVWLCDDKGIFTDLKIKSSGDPNFLEQTYFLSLNDKNGFFNDEVDNWYLFTSPYNPNDIDKLKKSIHFDKTFVNQYVEKINVPLYQGIASNGKVKLNIWHDEENVMKNITKVTIDGNIIGKTGDRYVQDIEMVGKHEIVIYNKLTTNLVYTLYIKDKPTIDTITNVNGDKMENYVGTNDNNDELFDVLYSKSEVQITYDSFLYSENTITKLNNNLKPTDTKTNIFSNQTFSKVGNYLIQTKDLVGNSWQLYLSMWTSPIPPKEAPKKYWESDNGKDLWNKALEHKYTKENLEKMNASQIKDLINKSKDWKYPINLDTITSLDLGKLVVNDKSKYIDLIAIIINAKELQDKYGNKLLNPTIKFMDMTGEDISNEMQKSGNFQIQIIASNEDHNFVGKTKNITLALTSLPTPTPVNSNGLSAWVWVFMILCTISIIGIISFLITKFLYKPYIKKRKDIKAKKFVAEQIKEIEKEKK